MTLINDIRAMQQNGMSDNDIFQNLASQGLSPMEVSQAIEQ